MIKNSLAAFVVLVSVYSCKKETAKVSDTKNINDTIARTESKADDYEPIDTVYSPKNTTEDYTKTLEWYQSKTEKELERNTPEQNNKVYENYIKIRSKYIEDLSRLHSDILDKYVNYYDSEHDNYKFPENVKKIAAELKKQGLEFREVGEGYTEIWSVPGYYYSLFKNKVTPDYNAYIQQLAKESETNYSADAGLMISFKDLGERIIFWENFIKKYPQSPLVKDVKIENNNYLYDYLFGMDNTPTFERADGKLYDENKAEFNRIIKKHPNSYVAKKAKELLHLFEVQTPVDELHKKINIERQY